MNPSDTHLIKCTAVLKNKPHVSNKLSHCAVLSSKFLDNLVDPHGFADDSFIIIKL